MKGTLSLQRLKRAIAVAGVGAVVVGGAVLGTTQANAAVGTIGSGTGLTLSPASGAAGSAATTTPTFSSVACPAGDNGSAIIVAIDPTTPSGTPVNQINGSAVTGVISPANATFTGTWGQTLASLEGATAGNNINAGVQFEVAAECFSDAGASQNPAYGPSTFVTINADGSFTANQVRTGPPASVNIALSASPNPAVAGQSVTLTATATPAGTGTVQFVNNGTNINGSATLSGGVATTTTTFAAPGTANVTAVYTPSGNFTAGTVTPLTLTVGPAPANTIPLAVSVPVSGSFSLTVNSATVVNLTASGLTASGTTTPIVVADTRNNYPGWAVSGQDSAWTETGGSGTFSGNQLGWTPVATTGTTLPAGVHLGPQVNPLPAPGIGLGTTPGLLAQAHAGDATAFGSSSFSPTLALNIPANAPAGPYTSGLTISAVTTNP